MCTTAYYKVHVITESCFMTFSFFLVMIVCIVCYTICSVINLSMCTGVYLE